MDDMSEPITIRNVQLQLKDGIVYYYFLPNATETLEDAVEKTAKVHEIFGDTKVPFLIYGDTLRSMNHDSRAYYGTEAGSYNVSAMAIVALNPLSKVLGNFFVGLNKPLYPIKMFTSKEDAAAWLEPYKVK